MSTWAQTTSGVAFDLLDPRAEDVRLADIAHALSRINRFSGHTHGEPYSVAHHSMLVADLLASWGAPVEVVLEGLLHDAPEAYYGDITSPVKSAVESMVARAFKVLPAFIRDAIHELAPAAEQHARWMILAPLRAFMKPIDECVRGALDIPVCETDLVKRADLVALAIERRDLFGGVAEPRDWRLPEHAPPRFDCSSIHDHAPRTFERLDPESLCDWRNARERFLALHAELATQIEAARTAKAASAGEAA